MEVLTSLILAAGRGTRMPSPRPKVLQTLLGETMLALVTAALHELDGRQEIFTLVGNAAAEVSREAEAAAARLGRSARLIEQKEQRGTGHALMTALPQLPPEGRLLVVNGDAPLVTAAALERFLERAWGADVAFLSLELDDAASYGRVVRRDGAVRAIVEAKDFDPALYGPKEEAREVNTGIYLFSLPAVRALTPRLGRANASGEYYITDLAALGLEAGMDVRGIRAEGAGCEAAALLGVNTPAELAEAESLLQERRASGLLASGVILHQRESVRVSPFSRVEAGAELFGPCEIYGDSRIESGARVRSHCVLRDAVIRGGAEIREFCHIDSAEARKGAVIGPYARLRPQTLIDEDAHAGSFVEIKKTRLGKGSKANHLTYLGDTEAGPGVNFGAGTITCNYDGVNKHRTVIGANCFIGSNTAFVAPVSVGEGALVGAGSVIVEDVPPHSLALGRGRQVVKPLKKTSA
ncbi:bifunctional UDP-N-acetylglucosamine diphosphorylase/glucosamine-1-phosphate N-acetyltransferase GlmU [uncultured Mailhella sp.]|uniref:bifunctional UDP-N-acetylglucosamine diphosphorylase/glucosamine-1-phosphate N-acetyltransferase GlmU n=1 Tax=uncultured Mailhella sp. TaxID=1981031 RepID=UPI00260AF69B|nr:bifunctional UDP-N-acetylglucosamine diphosphorylase/glucosamine-1-phosphate N-acetyltransferase GlmU [uncultured Mailhella sp.]